MSGSTTGGGFSFQLDDVDRLVAAEPELAALDAELTLTDGSLLGDLMVVRRRLGGLAGAAVETIRLRRRAVAKLGEGAAGWLLTDEALQQATPASVAAHRAQRLAGRSVHDLTCSIGADLAALALVCPVVLGSDLDPVRARMARHNTAAPVVVADALRPVSRGLLGYADPARRSAGRRILSAETVPSIAELDQAWAHRPPVLRVPPGIDYDGLRRPGEVEIVSLDGSVREAVLWPAELATVGRRASVLSDGAVSYELTDADPEVETVHPAGEWLVDPDGAVVRAHLVRQFAARHGLWQLDPHLAYLSGDRPPPFGRAFRVLESAPFSEKTVASWLRSHDAGALEIKVRGVPIDPDAVRIRLRKALRGGVGFTLVVARIGRRAVGFLTEAHRADSGSSGLPG